MAEPWLVDSFAPPAGATSTWGGACPRRWFHIDDRRRRPAPRWTSSGLATLIGRAW